MGEEVVDVVGVPGGAAFEFPLPGGFRVVVGAVAEEAPEGGHAAAGEEDEEALRAVGGRDADEDGAGGYVDDAAAGDSCGDGVLVEAGGVGFEECVGLGCGVHRE